MVADNNIKPPPPTKEWLKRAEALMNTQAIDVRAKALHLAIQAASVLPRVSNGAALLKEAEEIEKWLLDAGKQAPS